VFFTEENLVIANVAADMFIADIFIADMFIVCSISILHIGVNFRGYCYFTVKIKFHPNSEAEDVCPDTGNARTLVDREWIILRLPNVLIR
jgi:hypothetical protein